MIRGLFLFMICFCLSTLNSQIFPKTKSALAEGELYKIAFKKSGIHKVTKKNLEDLGIKISSINPKNIKLLINYGGSLPQPILKSYPDDLIEISITVTGEEDGKFDDNDLILFYAEGADKWKYNDNAQAYRFDKNIYSDNNYAFIKIGSEAGKRLTTTKIEDASPSFTTDKFESLQVIHEDKFNLLGQNISTHGSGKMWVGNYVQKNIEKDLTSSFDLKDIDFTAPIKLNAQVVSRSDVSSKFEFILGSKVLNKSIDPVSFSANEAQYATIQKFNEASVLASLSKIALKHNGTDAWIDFVELSATQSIKNTSGQSHIYHQAFAANDYSSIIIKEGQTNFVYDVTDLQNIVQYEVKNQTAAFKSGKQNQQLLLFRSGAEFSVEPVGKVSNQNLHSLENLDLLIVYHNEFKEAALKIDAHRKSNNRYACATVDIAQVYNEFSSGRVDPTAIRNLARMLYERGSKLKYLLLIGDGSYDYKGLVSGVPRHNFIPVYETDESLDPIDAFPTDDYYALLSTQDGATLKGGLELGVGRLTVTTADEAMAVVDKIIAYDISPDRFGEWRINNSFSADDEDGNRHIDDANGIAEKAQNSFPVYNQTKTYFDAFAQENTPGGERYPDATENINQTINKGTLTWTYLGHGGPKGLAQERVVKLNDIENWENKDRYTLLITATCSFAGYDDPSITSGGELALLNAKGGAVALYTTVRSVYADQNERLTQSVFNQIYKKEGDKALTFGEIMRRSKNSSFADSTGDNTRKFTLLGDPSQPIALPEYTVKLIKINKKNIDAYKDTIGALDKIEFEGEIVNSQGNIKSDFDGDLSISIYDKESELSTLANDGGSKYKFNVYRNILFKGAARVIKGRFTIECVLPKDINYAYGKGRISFYAHNDKEDAAGYNNDIVIGGSSKSGVVDDKAPTMQVYINDEMFIPGGITDNKPKLLIKLQDDYGINITGNSIGHDITARLLGEGVDEEFVLNDFYQADQNSFRSGNVLYPLSNLKPGLYTLKCKAWDLSNNSVEGQIEFRVVDKSNTKLERVINYPNPFIDKTTISFEHDLANATVDIVVNIYTVSGKLVKSITQSTITSGYRVDNLSWNGKDDFESNLARGVYLYKISMYAPEYDLKRESGFLKIVKL